MKQETIKKKLALFARALGLSKWKFSLAWGASDLDNAGEVEPHPNYEQATIQLDLAHLQKKKRREVNEVLLHELLHVALSPYTTQAMKLAGKRGRKVLADQEERLILRLTRSPLFRSLTKL